MFPFRKKDPASLTDEQVEAAYARSAQRHKTRKNVAGFVVLGAIFGGGGLGVCAMGAIGMLAVGGGAAMATAFCGMMIGAIGTIGIVSKIKPLNNWMEAKDLHAITGERHRRVALEQERQTVLPPLLRPRPLRPASAPA